MPIPDMSAEQTSRLIAPELSPQSASTRTVHGLERRGAEAALSGKQHAEPDDTP